MHNNAMLVEWISRLTKWLAERFTLPHQAVRQRLLKRLHNLVHGWEVLLTIVGSNGGFILGSIGGQTRIKTFFLNFFRTNNFLIYYIGCKELSITDKICPIACIMQISIFSQCSTNFEVNHMLDTWSLVDRLKVSFFIMLNISGCTQCIGWSVMAFQPSWVIGTIMWRTDKINRTQLMKLKGWMRSHLDLISKRSFDFGYLADNILVHGFLLKDCALAWNTSHQQYLIS